MHYFIFSLALIGLLVSSNYFTNAAEAIGKYLKLPSFVVGVFIVGIGTSLPELISGILSVNKGASEILSGNIIGANISNILLITGLAVVINKKNISLKSGYMYIDLNYLIGSFLFFYMIAYDGKMDAAESFFGLLIFIVYSIYLIKGEAKSKEDSNAKTEKFPIVSLLLLLVSAVGIYFGADYTIISLEKIAFDLSIPKSIVALTLLSLGTTLPELAVNISAIKNGKAEMAIGNVLGSSIFNTLVIPAIASFFGTIVVTNNLLQFSLPVMAACGLLFYLLTQDKKISVWEGLLFICLYSLFIFKTATV
ncbi:sodium:calcium antiporter [Flavobacterium sp. GCM10023249]|uniref:sodium:calcium antiporter n=1 Tax=unclassified Flavobacterium TaxID=196869 RepID=UPI00360FB690